MQLKDEYHHTAAIYDLLFSRSLRNIRSNICTLITHYRARNVIDLCCGTGEQLRMLCRNDTLLTGVDLSPSMLAQAREKSPASIHYLEADASQLPLPHKSFDAVIISLALHEKTSRQNKAIFREACRLLQPDGHIIIADYSLPPSELNPLVLGRIVIPAIERMAGITHYHNYRDWMKNGAIEGFLARENPGETVLISPHFQGCVSLYAASRIQETPLQSSLKKIQLNDAKVDQLSSMFPSDEPDND